MEAMQSFPPQPAIRDGERVFVTVDVWDMATMRLAHLYAYLWRKKHKRTTHRAVEGMRLKALHHG